MHNIDSKWTISVITSLFHYALSSRQRKMKEKIKMKLEMCPWDTDAPATAKFAKLWIIIKKGNDSWRHNAIWAILYFEKDIMVLNNVTKFHKILTKSIRLRERTSFQTVNLHKKGDNYS